MTGYALHRRPRETTAHPVSMSLATLDSRRGRLEDEYLAVSYLALRGRHRLLHLALVPSRHGVHRSLTSTPQPFLLESVLIP
jgi:hypothetical protein